MGRSTHRRLRQLIVVLALVPIASGIGANRTHAQDDTEAFIARIEGPQIPNRQGLDGLTIAGLMQRLRVPGVTIAVIKDFQIHWAKGYGVADVETGRRVETKTTFQAASISKPVTAMAAIRLVQEHRLELDTSVNTILTSWRIPESDLTRDRPVTPRALFSHTSGEDAISGVPGYDPGAPLPTIVQILDGQPPSARGPVRFARPPFQAYKYSGGGVTIMQLALMDLTGQSFAEFMQSTVLGPLEMTNSSYQQPPTAVVAEQAARAHDAQGRGMSVPWRIYPAQAAAGLWTTPSDLARFVIEVQKAARGPTGKVLSQAMAQEMVSPVGVGPFAVGLAIEKRGEGWYFAHGGDNLGFKAKLLGHIRKGYGVVIMTNGDNGETLISELEARVAAAYNWDSLDKPIAR